MSLKSWVARHTPGNLSAPVGRPGWAGPVIVALPVKDEEDRIAACLDALDNQVTDRADQIVLLLNNCSDRTASIVRGLQPSLVSQLHVREVQLSPHVASAGYARHLALEEASRLAGEDGILLTTDADGRVDPDWVGTNIAALQAGADAVAGWAELDPLDWGTIPLRLHEDDARECAYDAVCDEIHALLDPDPSDPMPRHTQASGASIAVTAAAYRAAGGMPTNACGEDRAFIAALRRVDARIRHAPECRVLVSGRIEGRAAGGMADTIRRRLLAPDRYLDDRLEPADDCARRASLRWLTRLAYQTGRPLAALPTWLGLEERVLQALLDRPTFGSTWAELERLSPALLRRFVSTAELSNQQDRAEAIRNCVRHNPSFCRETILNRMPSGEALSGLP